MAYLLAFFVLVVAVCAQEIFQHCDYVVHLDCSSFSKSVLCGSDGKNYNSKCDLAKVHCQHRRVHELHAGECRDDHTVDPTHGNSTDHILIQGVFCQAVEHVDCSHHHKQSICASNHHTYDSMCSYEKARCLHLSLHILHMHAC